jgi:cellulose biosynthesis protein BcsQ
MEVITFFSYKGGAGRSSTALNTLPYLVDVLGANEKSPILLLDMDLDSAGMTYLLEQEPNFKSKGANDVKQFLTKEDVDTLLESPAANLEGHEFYEWFRPVGNALGIKDDRAVMFLGVNDEEVVDVEQMSLRQGDLWRNFRTFCKNNNITAVILDSAAGTQYIAKQAVKHATLVVNCLRATKQFRIGTFNYLRKLREENPRTKVILLPTVIPVNIGIGDESQYSITVNDIKNKIKIFRLQDMNIDFVNVEKLGINEVVQFKWLEGVLYKIAKERDLVADEQEAAKRYKQLAEIIGGISKGRVPT